MVKQMLFWAIFLSLASCGKEAKENSHTKGTIVVDGGDQLYCDPSAENRFSGPYMLDYFLTDDGTPHPEFTSWEGYKDRIVTQLQTKFPALATSLTEYFKYFLDSSDKNPRIWKPASQTELEDISDEDLSGISRKFPKNCMDAVTGKPKLKQLVRREVLVAENQESRKVFYHYDKEAIDNLKNTNPLQLSYLAVHEWLWDYVNNAWTNRTINHLFQSNSLDTMTASEIKEHLASLGVEGMSGSQLAFNSEAERKIAEDFSHDPTCNFANRYIVDFLPLSNTMTLPSGYKKKLSVQVPKNVNVKTVCGIAILFKSSSVGSSSQLKVKIGRNSQIEFPENSEGFEFKASSKATYSGLVSQCKDLDCIDRVGPFSELINKAPIGGSTWDLTFKSSEGETKVENPVIMFIPRSTSN